MRFQRESDDQKNGEINLFFNRVSTGLHYGSNIYVTPEFKNKDIILVKINNED